MIAAPSTPSRTTERDSARAAGVHRYAVFGGVLASSIPFVELAAAAPDAPPRWRFQIDRGAPPVCACEPLGTRSLGIERYALARTPDGFRLDYSHAGIFDVAEGGRRITWYARDDAPRELVRNIVLGPALALALECAGVLCLHGSAVVIDGAAVAFVGPKEHGKSTLATALTRAGAKLVGDDLIAIVPASRDLHPIVLPGVASVRLWSDAAATLQIDAICDDVRAGIKTTAAGFDAGMLATAEAPLAAIYSLVPVRENDDGRAAQRVRLGAAAAAATVAQQTKLSNSLIGLRAAGAQLAVAASIAAATPVYALAAVRDFARLPALVTEILAWHRCS